MKTHLIYLSIIAVLLAGVVYLGLFFYLSNRFEPRGYTITKKTTLIDRVTGKTVATFEPGLVLRSPSIQDLDDTDLGDNSRFKLLIDVQNPASMDRSTERPEAPRYLLK